MHVHVYPVIYIGVYVHCLKQFIYMHAYTTRICTIALQIIYFLGKHDSLNTTERNHSRAVMMTLVEKLEGKGHCQYTDNF